MTRAALLVLLVSCDAPEAPAALDDVDLGPIEAIDAPPSTVVCLLPFEPWDRDLAAAVEAGIGYLFGFDTVLEDPQSMPEAAYYAPNRRWRADTLLDLMDGRLWPGDPCDIALGITTADIATTKGEVHDWGIFGLGQVGGRTAMISSYRLGRGRGPEKSRERRLVKVANHEVGHVLGLPHVNTNGCLMHDAEGSIGTVDRETGLLCASTVRYIERTHRVELPDLAVFDWDEVLGERSR